MILPVVEKNSVTDKTSNLVHVGVILNPQILNDEPLTLHGVLAHIIFQQWKFVLRKSCHPKAS